MADADPFAPEAFKKPPNEVTRFFNEKKLQPSFHWQDVMLDEHALAFTVAKSAGYDVLADIQKALVKTIEQRQDFDEFRKSLEPLLKNKGWWGKAQQIDPLTGKPVEVRLGSVRRLKTIYWANVETAYAAGEWERTWRTRRVLPYLEYLISTAAHKRPEHLEWVGTVLEVEDPWWDTHYPPNGWNCQCRVRQLSEEEAQGRPRFGDRPEDLGSQIFVNKRTGEVSRVPNGIDPGWNNNPGKFRQRNAADLIAGRLDAMDETARRIAAADLAGSSLVRHIAGGGVNFDPASTDPEMIARGDIALPFAVLPEETARAAGARSHVLRLSVRDAQRISAPPEAYGLVQTILDRGRALAKRVEAQIAGVWRRLAMRVERDGAAVYLDGLETDE
jgi:SPP1 gp7 family putative phage head morphogenesis protein